MRLFLGLIACLFLAGCQPRPETGSSNAILVVAPYQHAGTWVFDDAARGIFKEPFVSGIPEMIDQLVQPIPEAGQGFRLLFSAREFPGYTHTLEWRREEAGGNWYHCPELDREGWLCSVLFAYFNEAPRTLYIKAEAKSP